MNALRARTSAPISTAHPFEVARRGANLVAPGSASPHLGRGWAGLNFTGHRGRGVPPTLGLKQTLDGKRKNVTRFRKELLRGRLPFAYFASPSRVTAPRTPSPCWTRPHSNHRRSFWTTEASRHLKYLPATPIQQAQFCQALRGAKLADGVRAELSLFEGE